MGEGADWPVRLRGVTETVVATRTAEDRWAVAALGVHAPETDRGVATARTWGRTRTRENFADRATAYVQFTPDPVDFVEAALAARTAPDPILDSAAAWASVRVDRVDAGTAGGTRWADWALHPVESAVERRTVPTTNRGFGAVVEASVLASRLAVPAYDRQELEPRLAYLAEVVETCGGERELTALERVRELSDW